VNPPPCEYHLVHSFLYNRTQSIKPADRTQDNSKNPVYGTFQFIKKETIDVGERR